jgi:hypothetical protein
MRSGLCALVSGLTVLPARARRLATSVTRCNASDLLSRESFAFSSVIMLISVVGGRDSLIVLYYCNEFGTSLRLLNFSVVCCHFITSLTERNRPLFGFGQHP